MLLQYACDLLLFDVETKRFKGDFELVVVYVVVFVEVEEGKLCARSFVSTSISTIQIIVKYTHSLIDLLPLVIRQVLEQTPLIRLPSISLCAFLSLSF